MTLGAVYKVKIVDATANDACCRFDKDCFLLADYQKAKRKTAS